MSRASYAAGGSVLTWQNRLHELLLAGGALAALGYGAGSCSNGSHDASGPDDGGSHDASGPDDGGYGENCCNVKPDPCCTLMYCGQPATSACTAKIACLADGGSWTDGQNQCRFPDGGSDALADAPADASSDAQREAGHD